jgi:hypothetical protein
VSEKASRASSKLVFSLTEPPVSFISAMIRGYWAGSVTTLTYFMFLDAARTMAGPPMSMFSMASSSDAPLATVSSKRRG